MLPKNLIGAPYPILGYSDYNNTNIQVPWLAPVLTHSTFVSFAHAIIYLPAT